MKEKTDTQPVTLYEEMLKCTRCGVMEKVKFWPKAYFFGNICPYCGSTEPLKPCAARYVNKIGINGKTVTVAEEAPKYTKKKK
jgi:hypothetical protein